MLVTSQHFVTQIQKSLILKAEQSQSFKNKTVLSHCDLGTILYLFSF